MFCLFVLPSNGRLNLVGRIVFAEQKRGSDCILAYAATNEMFLSRGGSSLGSGTEISRRMLWSSVFCVVR